MLNSPSDPVEPRLAHEQLVPAELGASLRRLRQIHGMSQRKLAQLAGMTNGAISMIEKNRVSPSVASLKKILDAFGLSLAEFFSEDFSLEPKYFFRAEEMTSIAQGSLELRQVGANVSRRKLQVLHEKYAAGGDTGAAKLAHEGEEAGVIIHGRIEITVGGQREVLGPGDGYYFNSRLPHRFRNVGTEVCEIVSVCTPPTF